MLQQVRETTLEGYAHQELPFEKLVEAVQPQRDLRRSPLFQVMFVLQNTPATPLTLPGVEAQIEIIDVEAAPFEITCSIEERGEGLEVGIQYASELFEAATIQRLLRSYETLLEQCALNPDISIWSVPLLTAQDQQHFAALWERSLPTRPLFLHKLFEEQAVQRPDALAVVSEGNALSYRELEERANGLAHRLVAQGVGPETLVGLCIQRSPEMLIGLLAILKAGGAYVPLDPVYPSERLRLMLEDACPPVVLTLERLRAHLPLSNLPSTQCVCLDVDSNGHTPAWDVPPPVALNRQNLAYVIYTSGSTGNPKGVCITHEASASFCQSMTEHYAFVSTERVLQFTSLSFDLALEEIFATLSRGATLVLWPPQENIDLIEFTHFLALQCVSVINLSSSLWNVWLDTLIRQEIQPHSALRLVITGNEPIEIERLRLWQEYVGTRLRWLHAYGVTEATVTSTFCASDMFNASAWEGPVSIGLPIYNTRIYILDAHGQPVPPGVPGELYLGGGELARGYLHHPEVTAERFLPNPFASTPGSLLYKTGDLVRYGEDGLLRYLGRDDQQVKIRGFRIELAEVERVLALHPALKEVVVAARTDLAGKKDLVAYFVSRHGQLQPYQEMLHFLQERLPAFMLPAAFVQLEQLPKLPNGKIDRQRLPEPEYSLVAEDSDALLPRTPLEDLLLNIWKDLLQLENISIQANFFALGGYSLLAAQVTSRLRRALRREIPVRLIFEYPTIAQLAAHLEMQLQEEVYGTFSPIQTLERNVAPALSFEQLRLWFLDQLEPGSALYNLPTAIHLKGPLQVEALARSLHALLARHESLRTSFVQPAGQSEPVQVIAAVPAASTCLLPCVDLRSLPPAHRMDHALQLARAQVQRPFDLAQGPLYRWLLLRLDAQEHVLVLCLHHILADGWSLVVALRELSALYAHALRRTDDLASVLPTLPVQFADYASWQRGALQGQALADLLGYWTRQLEGAPLELELPTDHARPAQPSHRGALLTCSLPQPMGEQLRRRARQEDVTLFMLLLAAFGVLLVRWSGQEDLLVGTPVANRGRQETEGVIGCLVNTLVVRLQAGRARTFREVLQQVRETTLEGYAHQELPFEKLVEAVQPQRDLRRSPL
ncbi:MAG TPA: amino acid adenylation domain-containing protein, partial [Ktedonobacteraceae bacterium]|nr:amino acid adenylation domain-containing protein [Ktedonobacteraceae bacterium]